MKRVIVNLVVSGSFTLLMATTCNTKKEEIAQVQTVVDDPPYTPLSIQGEIIWRPPGGGGELSYKGSKRSGGARTPEGATSFIRQLPAT